MSKLSKTIRPGLTLSIEHPEVGELDLALAEVIAEMAGIQEGTIEISMNETGETVVRCRAKETDATTGKVN